jgi:hypothetical protein
VTKNKAQTTRLIGAEAIRPVVVKSVVSHNEKDQFLFLIRAYNEATSIGAVVDSIVDA